MARSDISKLGVKAKWNELTPGMVVVGSGTSAQFETGEWAVNRPEYIEEKCKQCLLCAPVCPDSCIAVTDKKRGDFDFSHCKGCGICAKVCPFGAIKMKGVN